VAVRLAMEVSPRTVIATAHRLGVASDLRPDASIALGTSEVTPLELVNAYAPFANGGVGVQPHIIARVRRADGKQLYQRKGSSFGRVIEPQYVGMMNAMLQETLLTGTARKAELPGWQAAGKTGTSQDYRDAWFVGYTSQLVAGVWLGNDDGSPTKRASGANLPVDIWSRFMREALRNTPPAPLPGGALRDPGPLAQAGPPPIPQVDVPMPAGTPAPAPALAPVVAPAPVMRPSSAPPPAPQAQAQTQSQPPPRAPRREPMVEQTNDLLPPASIPRSGPAKGPLERLFGG
jgi:penicillin-binding protein 1A